MILARLRLRLYGLVERIREKHKVDLSKHAPDLVKRFTKPVPNSKIIDLLRKTRERGDIVMGATHYDYGHYQAYQAKMDDKGVDLQDIFSGIVVTLFNHGEDGSPTQEDGLWTEPEKGVYMITNPDSVKPADDYFEVVKKVGTKISSSTHQFVHVDPNKKCVKAATRNDFRSIRFSGSCKKLKKALK
jgi:hypothetical protein